MKVAMEIKVIKPASRLLQKYIAHFYIFNLNPGDKPFKFITFPTTFSIASINHNAKFIVRNNNVKISFDKNSPFTTYLAYNTKEPFLVEYSGAANEITTCFKPLGINRFIEKPLKQYFTESKTVFNPYHDYKDKMLEILSNKNYKQKIKMLESYWLSKYRNFEHPFLDNVVNDLTKENRYALNISEITAKYNVSRVTLNKHFEMHLCILPSEFRKISRLRNSMNKVIAKTYKDSFTRISIDANYFDQSHMIKDFRALTGYTPKRFFSKISSVRNGAVNWLLL